MNVRLINGTENPEEAVCTAARNDYRTDGVIDHDFEEVMDAIEPNDDHIVAVALNHDDAPLGAYEAEIREKIEQNLIPESILLEAKKRTLIDTLVHDRHWGPLEHPQAVVAIEGVTRVVTHQIVRHRHFSFDQQSLRYVELEDVDAIEDAFQMPKFRGEDFDVDRDGVHEIEDVEGVLALYDEAYRAAQEYYLMLLDRGVPKEQARKVLPMGTKTNIVMSGNARAWMHILQVRRKADVQGETRRCADAIFEELREWMPYSFTKYDETNLHGLNP